MVSLKNFDVSKTTRAPSRKPSATPLLALRPMARATHIAIFEREVRERLSKAAVDLLLDRAEVLSEGQRLSRQGRSVYEGSTMLTLELVASAQLFREPCDAGTARRLAAMLARDVAARNRIRIIAQREAERITQSRVRDVTAEIRVRAQGARVLVDVDLEARL
jgi:hypothetical protein